MCSGTKTAQTWQALMGGDGAKGVEHTTVAGRAC